MADTVNIGVIGCGRMATRLARKCVEMGRARIVAVADPDPDALGAAAAEFNAERARDFEALCARSDVDAVIVGSPGAAHLDNVLAAAANKKPVFCEKPLGLNVAQCDQMIAACEQAGVSLFVGQVLRLFPLFWQSHLTLNEGVIGDARAMSIIRAGYPKAFDTGWRSRRAESGGLLLEINAHELDYMRFLLGEAKEVYARMENVTGRTDHEDQAFVTVTFRNGASATLHSSVASPIDEFRAHIVATNGNMVHGGFSGTLRYRTHEGNAVEIHPADVGVGDPYDRELDSWLDSLTLGTPPLFTGADGRAAVAIAEAAYRSADLGRPVALDEQG